jgi:hypothetical protein
MSFYNLRIKPRDVELCHVLSSPQRGAVSLIAIVRLNNNALEPKALVDSTWNRLRGVQVENVPDVFYDLFRVYETRGGYVPYQEQLECLIRHGLLSRDGGPIEELRSIVLSSVQLGVNTDLVYPVSCRPAGRLGRLDRILYRILFRLR